MTNKERDPKIKRIRELLPREEILAQCAEECSELAKACHKLRRVYDRTNPTPVTESEAASNLVEEFADVVSCLDCLDFFESEYVMDTIKMIIDKKRERWIGRIEEERAKREKKD